MRSALPNVSANFLANFEVRSVAARSPAGGRSTTPRVRAASPGRRERPCVTDKLVSEARGAFDRTGAARLASWPTPPWRPSRRPPHTLVDLRPNRRLGVPSTLTSLRFYPRPRRRRGSRTTALRHRARPPAASDGLGPRGAIGTAASGARAPRCLPGLRPTRRASPPTRARVVSDGWSAPSLQSRCPPWCGRAASFASRYFAAPTLFSNSQDALACLDRWQSSTRAPACGLCRPLPAA